MTDVLLAVSPLEEFLTGSLFGYLLHAVQLGIAEGMCGIYLERRSRFALRAVGAVVVYLVLAACLGMLFGEIFPYISFLVSCVVSFPCFMFCFRCNLWDGLFCCVAAIGVQNLSYSVCIFCVGLFGWDVAQLNVLHIAVQTLIYLSVHLLCFVLGVRKLKDIGGGFGKERLVMIVVMLILTAIVYLMQYDRQTPGSADFFDWRILFICYDIISLLTAMRKRKKEWKRIIHLKGRGCVAENLSVIFSDRIKSRFTVSGICGSIAWWIESDMKESPEAFGRYLSDASGFEL